MPSAVIPLSNIAWTLLGPGPMVVQAPMGQVTFTAASSLPDPSLKNGISLNLSLDKIFNYPGVENLYARVDSGSSQAYVTPYSLLGATVTSPTLVSLAQSGAYGSQSISIASGATTSSATTALTGGRIAGLLIPSAFTGTSISFLVSSDNTTFAPFKQNGSLVTNIVAAGDAVDLLGSYPGLTAWPYVKIVSNATEVAVRTLIIVTV